jgi:hypothetical protein
MIFVCHLKTKMNFWFYIIFYLCEEYLYLKANKMIVDTHNYYLNI